MASAYKMNFTFQFAQMIITESGQYGKMDINDVNVHWRPFYLSPCGFCDVPFRGKYREPSKQYPTC